MTSLRTWIAAAAASTVKPSMARSPSASPDPRPLSMSVTFGSEITRTPQMPTATAVQRKSRTFSPRKTAAKTTVIRGIA